MNKLLLLRLKNVDIKSRYRRNLITTYDEIAPMVRAGLFEFGKDPHADIAYSLFPSLDKFLTEPSNGIETAFQYLESLMQPALSAPAAEPA